MTTTRLAASARSARMTARNVHLDIRSVTDAERSPLKQLGHASRSCRHWTPTEATIWLRARLVHPRPFVRGCAETADPRRLERRVAHPDRSEAIRSRCYQRHHHFRRQAQVHRLSPARSRHARSGFSNPPPSALVRCGPKASKPSDRWPAVSSWRTAVARSASEAQSPCSGIRSYRGSYRRAR
jgi:hypothetical protein